MNELLYDPRRLAATMADAGVDVLVVTRSPGVRYLTRFTKPGRSVAIVCRNDPAHPHLAVPAVELDYLVEDLVPGIDVHSWGEFVRECPADRELLDREALVADAHDGRRPDLDRAGMVAMIVTSLGMSSARIGFDVTPVTEPALTAALGAEVVDASDVVPRLRTHKTALEIERLGEAARIAESAITATTAIAAAGVTQAELATEFRVAVARGGGFLRVDSVSIGRDSVFGNANVAQTVLSPGDLLRFDIGAVYRGYQSDLSRCFSLGEPDAKTRRYAEAVIAGQSAALAMLEPGVRTAELFAAAVAETRRAGIPHYNRTHVGHGIGLVGSYDAPLLSPFDPHVIEAGMVLCVETPYYEFGFGGVQIEDMVVVTDSGWTPLSRLPRSLEIL
ncbi:MAG: Xaa-Pro peptidase family protein [Mycobacterium sp.]